MKLEFQHIEPCSSLKRYIEKMWLFKSNGRMPADDMKLVVPNGNLKLTISYQNGIVAEVNGKAFSSKEHDITLTGLVDVPVFLDTDKDIATETIGIEFNPKGVYHFFHFNLHEIKNQIYSLEDLLGKTGKQLAEQIANAVSVQEKLFVVQKFLVCQLMQTDDDLIFEYCIDKIQSAKGKITVKELEKKTGYSSRWLHMKFMEKIGASPKSLASVIRFKQYYEAFINGHENSFFKNDFYELYYDQSHFIKDFKRFTGLPPTKFEQHANVFGESYYRS